MNKRFLTALLTGAFFLASSSVFVSCSSKDYDDDIANLQEQIDKAALKSDLDALTSQLNTVSANASDALAKAEEALKTANATASDLADVKDVAEKAAADVADAIKAAADAQATADDAAKAAADAQATADQAIKDAAAAASDASKALEQIGKLDQTYVTAESLKKQLEDLKKEIGTGSGEGSVDAYKGAIAELYSAISGVDLIDSFTGWAEYYSMTQGYGLSGYSTYYVTDYDPATDTYTYDNGMAKKLVNVTMTHGLVPTTSVFGDNELGYNPAENSSPLVNYTKGDDVKDPIKGVVVRVNPVNADITASKIVLVNSKGDVLDAVKIGTPERYNKLITRGSNINSGLWVLPFEVAPGYSEEDFAKATTYEYNEEYHYTTPILYAVGINNTEASAEGRYVVSSYDVSVSYKNYTPANHFTFSVSKTTSTGIINTSVEQIHNRWNGVQIQGEETAVSDNAEKQWKYGVTPTAVPAASATVNAPAAGGRFTDILNYTDARFTKNLFVVAVGDKFVVNSLKAYTEDGVETAIDSMYVVVDKPNAIESAPSEINAWNSYEFTGINQTVSADKNIELTVKSPSADGDVIGFRVYAVNRDGSLVDPDGRAFYILVTGEAGATNVDLNVKATRAGNTDTSNKKALTATLRNEYSYELNVNDGCPQVVANASTTADATLDYFQFNFFTASGTTPSATFTGSGKTATVTGLSSSIKNVSITPRNIENLIDGQTYTFSLIGYENIGTTGTKVARQVIIITLKKDMPTDAKTVQFRPKQEVVDGSGKFIAYMVPYTTPWADDYTASVAKTKGYKNLNNIFYNLNEDDTYQFDFAGSPKYTVNYDAAGTDPFYYVLDVNASNIDGKTEHGVSISTVYPGISTTVSYNADGTPNTIKFNKDYPVASSQSLTAIYACWHHAITNKAWTGSKPSLQWTHAGTTVTSYTLSNIKLTNSYDNVFFGRTLAALISDNYLELSTAAGDEAHLVTKVDAEGKPTTDAQIDPYFTVTVNAAGQITFSQASIQADANPVANHTEYLVLTFVDAYNHKVIISNEVEIKRAQ